MCVRVCMVAPWKLGRRRKVEFGGGKRRERKDIGGEQRVRKTEGIRYVLKS